MCYKYVFFFGNMKREIQLIAAMYVADIYSKGHYAVFVLKLHTAC